MGKNSQARLDCTETFGIELLVVTLNENLANLNLFIL